MLVHERLNKLVAERGITQTALAIKLEVSHDWINARLIGRTQIKADELPLIAGVLGVDPCSLLGDGQVTDIPEPFRDAFPSTVVQFPFPQQSEVSLGQQWGAYIEERASHLPLHEREAVQYAASIINTLISRAG